MTWGKLGLIIVAAIAALIAAPASARECTGRRAPAITFADAATGPLPTRCVMIEGIAIGRLFIADEQARYRREVRENDPSSSGAVMGLYANESFDTPTRVRIIGKIVDCQAWEQVGRVREARANPNSIFIISGYCHYYRGRTLLSGRVTRLGDATITRLRRSEAAPELGNLAPLAPGDDRERLIAAADRLFAAIKGGDREEIIMLHGGGPGGTRPAQDLQRTLHLLLEDHGSPFAALRAPGGANVEIFGWREPLWANDEWRDQQRRASALDAIACYSVRPDAAALWPIDTKDADNLPGRPYACTRIHISGTGADAGATFETEQARAGAVEPL